jgi:O-glycosyl hydrolase
VKRRGRLLAVAAVMLAAFPSSAAAPERAVRIDVHPALDRPGRRFEGWGTALAWFAEVTGGWPNADRQHLADLLYGRQGLGWTIARYNIGGGNPADVEPYLRPGAAVPGFWHQPAGTSGRDWWDPADPAMWDWSADPNQRWWLDAVAARVDSPIFEAFSNSPPWFMTVSGRVSGAEVGVQDNLGAGKEPQFAAYLTRVVDELQRRHHIAFRTLSPVNEPNTDYWFAANRQEGSHWSPARQAKMIDATAQALHQSGLRTAVSAPDETNSQLLLQDWAAYPPGTRRAIGQINVHSYGTVHQTAVRDLARATHIRLWMSENDTPLGNDPEDFTGMASALAFGEHVVLDLKRLEPAAWIFWQAVEDLSARDGAKGSNWGLIKADLRAPADGPHPIHITSKYWVMAQFSRFIRPGYRLVPVDDADTVGALSPDRRTLVLVHVNGGPTPRRLVTRLPGWSAKAWLTDAARHGEPADAGVAPPRSIVTLVLRRASRGPA